MISVAGLWAARKTWQLSKPVRRALVYAAIALCIVITAVVAYRGIRDGIRRSIDDAYTRGHTAGTSTARAECQAAYLAAVTRAQQKGIAASDVARRSGADRASNLNRDRKTVEGYAREPRAPAADGCPPAADPRVVRAAGERAAALRSAEARLCDLRRAAGEPACAAGAD